MSFAFYVIVFFQDESRHSKGLRQGVGPNMGFYERDKYNIQGNRLEN
jgi:hypothetical protein